MKSYKMRMDGDSWMVSVLSVNDTGSGDGSGWPSERGGGKPQEAALGYLQDPDNKGAEICKAEPELSLIAVIDQPLAPSGKQWKVHLFEPYCIEHEDRPKEWAVRKFII